VGYAGKPLEVYLMRLLFRLFAEDTAILNKRIFQDYIEGKTHADGSDLAHDLNRHLISKKLHIFTYLDPACGCGNFLDIIHRELCLLELEVLCASHEAGRLVIDVQAHIKHENIR
jgi:hypothetical protein